MCCPTQERKKKGILVDLAGWVYLQGQHRSAQGTMGHSAAAFNRELLQYLVPFLLLSDLIMQTWRSFVFWMTNTKLLFFWTHSKRNVLTMLYKIIPPFSPHPRIWTIILWQILLSPSLLCVSSASSQLSLFCIPISPGCPPLAAAPGSASRYVSQSWGPGALKGTVVCFICTPWGKALAEALKNKLFQGAVLIS